MFKTNSVLTSYSIKFLVHAGVSVIIIKYFQAQPALLPYIQQTAKLKMEKLVH